MDAIEMLERFGVGVHFIPALPNEGCFVASQNIALIRSGLSGEEREAAAAQLLSAALAQPSAPLPR